jgi:intracellular sulfur oxidation DsrE/DsrF family protein
LPLLVIMAVAAPAAQAEKLKVVYHVSEPEKVRFTLGNMRNHIKGVGGPENVELVLVVHGPALKQFHEMTPDGKIAGLVSGLQEQGVAFNACGNTMRAFDYQLSELIPGFVRRDEGGVVRIAELQSKGYIYIRP